MSWPSGDHSANMFCGNGRTKLALEGDARKAVVHSLSGGQLVHTRMMRELRLGGLTLKDQLVAVVRRDPGDVDEGDGVLPLHLFASVTFNAREQSLVLRGYAE